MEDWIKELIREALEASIRGVDFEKIHPELYDLVRAFDKNRQYKTDLN